MVFVTRHSLVHMGAPASLLVHNLRIVSDFLTSTDSIFIINIEKII